MKPTTNESKESPTFIPTSQQNPGPAHVEYGEMNEVDAMESGYTDQDGKAVSMAKKDVKGTPTGAYTDVGAGRSSVVKSSDRDGDSKDVGESGNEEGSGHKTVEDAPKPREEQAP